MFKTSMTGILALLLVFIFNLSIMSANDAQLELNITGNYSDNILIDSSSIHDSYTIYGLQLRIHPIDRLEINLNSEYSYYSRLVNISNLYYGATATYLPFNRNSDFSGYIHGRLNHRSFKQGNNIATNNNFNASDYEIFTGVGYNLSSTFQLRIGTMAQLSAYENDELDDKYKFELFGGFNATLFNNNTLDIEAGYSNGNFKYLPELRYFSIPDNFFNYGVRDDSVYSALKDSRLKSYFISPRFSRPLGDKTGLSLLLSYRKFIDPQEGALVYGYSTGLISPWNSVSEGISYQLRLKSYLLKGFIIESGFGYWDKSYFKTLEWVLEVDQYGMETLTKTTRNAKDRDDIQRKVFMNIKKPIRIKDSNVLEISLNLEYANNSSTIEVYDYNNYNISTGIKYSIE